MQKHGDLQKQPFPLPKPMDRLDLVIDGQRQPFHDLGMIPVGMIAFGDVPCRLQNIILKIMPGFQDLPALRVVEGKSVSQIHAKDHHILCPGLFQKPLVDDQGRQKKGAVLIGNSQFLRHGRLPALNKFIIKGDKFILCDLIDLPVLMDILIDILDIIAHQQHIADIPVFQIKLPVGPHLVIQKLFDNCRIADCPLCHICQTLSQTQCSQTDILRCHQIVLVIQRKLDTSSAHIHDGSPFLDDLLKPLGTGRDGFIPQKPLLRIAQHLQPDPGL